MFCRVTECHVCLFFVCDTHSKGQVKGRDCIVMLLCRNVCDNPDVYFGGPTATVMFRCGDCHFLNLLSTQQEDLRKIYRCSAHHFLENTSGAQGQVFPGENRTTCTQDRNRPHWTALKVGHHRCLQQSTHSRLLKDTSPAGHITQQLLRVTCVINPPVNTSASRVSQQPGFGTVTCQPWRMCQN